MQHTGGVYRFLAVASADAQQPTPTLSPDELKRHQAELQRKEEELRRREEELRRQESKGGSSPSQQSQTPQGDQRRFFDQWKF